MTTISNGQRQLGWLACALTSLLIWCCYVPASAQSGMSMYDAFPISVNACGSTTYYDYQNNAFFYDNYGNQSPDVWYTFTLGNNATVNISLCGSNFDTYLYILDSYGSLVDSNDDNGPTCYGQNASLQVALPAGSYYIVAEGASTWTGDISFNFDTNIGGPTTGNSIANAIDAGVYYSSGTYSNLADNTCMANMIGQTSGEIYYKFTLSAQSDVEISACGSYIDTYMHLLDASGTEIAYNDDSYSSPCPGTASYMTISLPAGVYYIASEGYSSYSGLISTNLNVTVTGGGIVGGSSALSYPNHIVFADGTEGSISPVNTGIPASGVQGQTITFAGSGYPGDANGTGLSATFNNPLGTAADDVGNIYIADAGNHKIRKISPLGVVTTLAGAGSPGYADGTGTSAFFQHPSALVVDHNGNVYVSDQQNHRIRKITPAGVVTTIAGSGYAGATDGIGTSASFSSPIGLALDGSGNLFVCDYGNHKIRKITPSGVVSTYAGTGSAGLTNGTLLAASFRNPMGIAIDGSGNIYIADRMNHVVRKISGTTVSTLAGSGSMGSSNGTGSSASFNEVNGVAVDITGNVYVADRMNNMIRAITPAGLVSTLAGSIVAGTQDGTGAAAGFISPYGICIDGTGNLYIAENGSNNIRKILAGGAYSISPALPAGLNLNTATGVISGTPSATSALTNYSVTVNNIGNTVSDTFDLEIVPSANCLSPSNDQNYVTSYVPRIEGVAGTGVVKALSCNPDKIQTSIQYLDGLGRPIQTVNVMASSNYKKDIVQPIVYNELGQQSLVYLPYAEQSSADGSYKSNAIANQSSYYTNALSSNSGVVKTPSPFSESVYELSPLNKVVQQGMPGNDWQPVPNSTSGHTVKVDYLTNIAGEVQLWQINPANNGASTTLDYDPGKLFKTVTKDENWTSGLAHTSEEFKDMVGRIVLKRSYKDNSTSLSTYYIYDDIGNLRYVLPPAVNENGKLSMPVASFDETTTACKEWMYCYHYDGRKRVIEKRIPGKGWEYMIYNKLDQVVLSQDASQHSIGQWLFTKYDALGRVVMTGLYNDGTDPVTLQNSFDTLIETGTPLWEERTASGIGYTDNAFPQTIAYYHGINYYDDYDFPTNTFGAPIGDQATGSRTKTLPTGVMTTVLGTGDMLLTVIYYDLDGRAVQTKAQHYLANSINTNNFDETNNTIDFIGQLKESTRIHHTAAGNTTISNTYVYDHLGHEKSTTTSIDGQTPVLLSNLAYNIMN